MRVAIYNSGIPQLSHSKALGGARGLPLCAAALLFFGLNINTVKAGTVERFSGAQSLAHKIVAVTGPGAVSLSFENRSSLDKKDSDAVVAAIRADLESLGIRETQPEQAAATVAVTLSENSQALVWVAEIHQGTNPQVIVMVSVPRDDSAMFSRDAGAAIVLRKTALWAQEERILDVLVLEEDTGPKHIAVLDPDKVALYRMQNGRWQQETSLAITHARPWPRDVRGRLIAARDHLLDAYLPGVICRTSNGMPLSLNCRESDDPWPLVPTPATTFPSFGGSPAPQIQLGAFYAATRNFFTGALTPGIGKITTAPKFYSAAPLPRDKYVLWLFAAVDGQVHLIDGVSDQAAKLGWGSDIASVKTTCGSGWQVLATAASKPGNGIAQSEADSVRAYEFPDRDPVPASTALDFPGEITALWTEARGDTAIVVERNGATGKYEAFRLAVSCNQ